MRRRGLVALLVGIALFAGANPAHDADYPNRSVRVIVPYPAGGPTDLIARLAAQMLTESFGQDFVVENVSGASGRWLYVDGGDGRSRDRARDVEQGWLRCAQEFRTNQHHFTLAVGAFGASVGVGKDRPGV